MAMQKTCNKCQKEFRIISQEQDFLKEMGLPHPTECPTCRHQRRMSLRNDREFYKYPCKKCGQDMITTVNPDKKRIVYCLDCYRDFRANVDLTQVE